jgi:hypothetical protein
VTDDSIEAENLGGYAIHASDGEIGRVDQHDVATGVSYLLVATGPWILGRTVLLPASVIDRVDHENQSVYVKCTRAEIRSAPDYRDDESHRADLVDYYRSMVRSPGGTV